jgi:hypothetical protein
VRLIPAAAVVAAALAGASPPAAGRELWTGSDGSSAINVKLSLETAAVFAAPETIDPLADAVGSGLVRLRMDGEYRMAGGIALDVAWDNRVVNRYPATRSLGVLPPVSPAPFRIRQAGGNLFQSSSLVDYDELDRASVSWESDRVRVVAGRQAVGWGRGVIFSAVDIFAPFTPLEIDREWRRGVDAVNADVKLTKSSSIGVVLAAGPTWRESAAGCRLRGYLGPADAEILVAKRAEDQMYGATGSMAAGDAEVHAEAALFHTPGDLPLTGLSGGKDLLAKAILGISNNFLLGSGLKTMLEYHYSGFGAANPSGLEDLAAAPAFARRLARGDTQIVGRQAAALTVNYTFGVAVSAGLEALQSLTDPYGVLALSATWDMSDTYSVAITGYHGYRALDGASRGQFASMPAGALLQLKWYF